LEISAAISRKIPRVDPVCKGSVRDLIRKSSVRDELVRIA